MIGWIALNGLADMLPDKRRRIARRNRRKANVEKQVNQISQLGDTSIIVFWVLIFLLTVVFLILWWPFGLAFAFVSCMMASKISEKRKIE